MAEIGGIPVDSDNFFSPFWNVLWEPENESSEPSEPSEPSEQGVIEEIVVDKGPLPLLENKVCLPLNNSPVVFDEKAPIWPTNDNVSSFVNPIKDKSKLSQTSVPSVPAQGRYIPPIGDCPLDLRNSENLLNNHLGMGLLDVPATAAHEKPAEEKNLDEEELARLTKLERLNHTLEVFQKMLQDPEMLALLKALNGNDAQSEGKSDRELLLDSLRKGTKRPHSMISSESGQDISFDQATHSQLYHQRLKNLGNGHRHHSLSFTNPLDPNALPSSDIMPDLPPEEPEVDADGKRRRRKKNSYQMDILRNAFLINPKPEKNELLQVARETRLTYQEVSRWFRNERHKFKKYKNGLADKQKEFEKQRMRRQEAMQECLRDQLNQSLASQARNLRPWGSR